MVSQPATDMTRGPVLAAIVGFGIPLTVANLLQQGYLLADSIVVGRYLGVAGLAAVGASQPLFIVLSGAFFGVANAFAIRLAQQKGAGRDGEPAAVAALLVCTLAWSSACVGLTLLTAGPMLDQLGVGGQVARDSRTFLVVLSGGYPAIFGVGAVAAVLRGRGDSRSPMYLTILASALNVGLAWWFVGPLRLGIAGAALATVAANIAALAAGTVHMRRSIRPFPSAQADRATEVTEVTGVTTVTQVAEAAQVIQVSGVAGVAQADPVGARRRPRIFGPGGEPVGRAALCRELSAGVRLGLPMAAQYVLIGAGVMALVWIITPFGPAALAALTVVARLELFTTMIFLNLSGALTAFVAQNAGARRTDRIRSGLRQSVGLAVALTLLVTAVTLSQRAHLAALFAADRPTREVIARYILITYPFLLLYTTMVVIHGCLNGLGRTGVPLACTVLSFLAVRIPLSYLMGQRYGVDGIMWAIVIGWLVGFWYTVLAAGRPAISAGDLRAPAAA